MPSCARCGNENPADARHCGRCSAPIEPDNDATIESAAPGLQGSALWPRSFGMGRYDVIRFLGEGARKRVFLAHDRELDRDVAVAQIKTAGLDSENLARVRLEARAMGRLGDHPHIVTIYDIGDEDSQPYLVSHYMEGGSVQDLLARVEDHRLPFRQALRLAAQICLGLEHAHAHAIIHRDLKPANVWLRDSETAAIGDFGLAIALDQERLTMEGMLLGTVAYMPPEQALGRSPDARGDLYALGAMLYEMVTGRPPFLGDNAVAVISQHINAQPVAPSWHNPEIPRPLEALIMQLLSKDPASRPRSAADARRTIEALLAAGLESAEAPARDVEHPLDSLAGGVFIGRGGEINELRAGLNDALSGRGRVSLLVGEPGIGKTRTAEELATYARLRGAQVLWGRCYEGEGAPPYWPWTQVLRDFVLEAEPAAYLADMGAGAADIAQVVSEVRLRAPDLPEPPPLQPEQARFRLFDSVTTFLRNASRRTPLVIILDDLHWADRPSLLLLQFLARQLRGARLLIVATYRDVDLGLRHPLSQTLAELTREGLRQRIVLRGITESDVARLIEMTTGTPPPRSMVKAIYRETEGNPFFINEIVRLVASGGEAATAQGARSWSVAVPQSVREVIGRRLARLSQTCGEVLNVAAVAGRQFDLNTLEGVGGTEGDALLDALDEATAARVIAEVPGSVGRFAFSHALLRETLYEDLPASRRARLHLSIAETIERQHAGSPGLHLGEIAYHFLRAAPRSDLDKAVAYARRAAERAAGVLAFEDAARLYAMALQAMDLRGAADESERCDLLLALGDAQIRGGDNEQGRESFLAAASSARRVGAPERLAAAALGYGGLGFHAGVVEQQLVDLLEEALAALPGIDSILRSRVLSRLGRELYFSELGERRLALVRDGVAMARRLDDAPALAYALHSLHFLLSGASGGVPEIIDERVATAKEIIAVAEGQRDAELALQGHHRLIRDLLELGDMAEVDREIDRYEAYAEELRQPHYAWVLATFRCMQALRDGRLEDSERLAREALVKGYRAQSPNAMQGFGVHLGVLRREQKRMSELEEGLLAFVDQYPAVPAWRAGLALIYADMRRAGDAARELEIVAARDFTDVPRDAQFLPAMLYLAEVVHFLNDAPRAALLYDMLLPSAGHNIVVGDAFACYGATDHYLGMLAWTAARYEQAARHFEDALRHNSRMRIRLPLAHTQHRFAAMLVATGDRSHLPRAVALLNEALETARALGMERLLELAMGTKLEAQGIRTAGPGDSSIEAVVAAVRAERPDLREHAAPDGAVTILFTDIESSTEINEQLGDERWVALLRAHNAIVRREIAAHGGSEVKSRGDGFMIAFASPHQALRCAVGIQRAIEGRQSAPDDVALRVRIGVHTGQAIREADDFFGRNVVVAARIADRAAGGEILVSRLVRDLVEDAPGFNFGETRRANLKGLRGTFEICELCWQKPQQAGAD